MILKLSFTLEWGKDIWISDVGFAGTVLFKSYISDPTSDIFPYI
jgi:hypothetical protein